MREFALTFVHRLVALFRRRSFDDDLDAELSSHLEMAVEQNLRKGMNDEDARREALLSLSAASSKPRKSVATREDSL
jgi:hypothetical protein